MLTLTRKTILENPKNAPASFEKILMASVSEEEEEEEEIVI